MKVNGKLNYNGTAQPRSDKNELQKTRGMQLNSVYIK